MRTTAVPAASAAARILVLAALVSAVVFADPVVGLQARAQSGSSTSPAATARAAPARADVFAGAWSLDKELSDQPQNGAGRGDDGDANRVRRGGGGGFGGRGGGFGGRRGGGGFGNGGAAFDPQQAERQREALREVMNPPDHLTIVTTDSMLILTGPDGRTVRLSPDGKKIKDESTNVARKTRWDGDKLVSEISGLAGAKITETYSVDAEHHQLHVATAIEGGRRGAPQTITHVYDPDAR